MTAADLHEYDPVVDRDAAHDVLRAMLRHGPASTPHPGDWDWWTFHRDPRAAAVQLVGDGAVVEVGIDHHDVTAFGLSVDDTIELGRERLPGVCFTVNGVSVLDSARVAELEARGFVVEGEPWPVFEQPTAGVVAARVDGFEMRHVRGDDEAVARATAARLAFRSTMDPEQHVARYRRFMQSSAYVPEHDLVAVTPDGRIAAFAIIWPDAALSLGQFEPVGTHPEFQRRGLGRAIVRYGIERLADIGVERARVMTEGSNHDAIALYLAAGFVIVDHAAIFRAPASFGA